MHKIGIIGNGFVGRATITLQCDDINIMCYDVNPNLCVPKGTTMHDLLTCCAIFVSVPTPINRAGKTSMKYVGNTFLATKISFCNEIHGFCKKQEIDYDRMVDIAAEDARICKSHTAVPGHDGRFGFGGTCFPKDINSLRSQMEEVGVQHCLIDAVIHRNDCIDRAEKDWMHDIGRTVVHE